MSYDDEAFRLALQRAVADLPLAEPTPEQYAVRRRNHERLLRAGLVREAEQDPAALRAWLGEDPRGTTR
jgi:hypothetical protein